MGKLTNGGPDLANNVVETALANNGDATPWIALTGVFNAAVWGTAGATVKLQCSTDGGVTALDCTNLGAIVSFAVGTTAGIREQMDSREPGMLHRLIRTSAAGPCTARLSQ